jgi:L-threonylcarbamoyladenylate synthase
MPLVPPLELVAQSHLGKVISFPTDTVPALAVRPANSEQIYALKQRAMDKPLIVMAATLQDLEPFLEAQALECSDWSRITAQYWPGALTLVLTASDRLPLAMNPKGDKTIGVRVPALALAREILSQTGPLATTSANLSGQPPLTTQTAIAQAFPTVFTLDCGDQNHLSLGNNQPSTVAQWTGEHWQILRSGQIQLV